MKLELVGAWLLGVLSFAALAWVFWLSQAHDDANRE